MTACRSARARRAAGACSISHSRSWRASLPKKDAAASSSRIRPSATRELAAAVERLFARVVAGAQTPAASIAFDEALALLVAALLARHASGRAPRAGSAPAIRIARERLDASPADAVSLAELASLAGVSRFQLLRGFARELGITPHAYLIQSRARLARALLARGLSIAQAAAEAGFADQSHLTRAFVRQFGITPGRFASR